MSGPARLLDRGAQAERTLLAWTRTCIALAAVALLVLRLVVTDAPLALLGVPPLLLTAVSLHFAARRRYRAISSGSVEPAGPLLITLTVSALVVSALCAVSVVG